MAAVTEKREVVVAEPAQELDAFGELVGRQRRRMRLEFGDDGGELVPHWLPVVDRHAHVAERVGDLDTQHAQLRRLRDAIDLDVNE